MPNPTLAIKLNTPVVLSDELQLCLLQAADEAGLFAQIETNRLHLRQWLPWLDDAVCPSDTRAFIALTINESRAGTSYTFAIKLHGAIIGICSIDAIETTRGRANLGYWLAEEHCGQGIMTLCVRQLLDIAFTQLSLQQLNLNTAECNQKSRAVAQRLGFRQGHKILQAEDLYGEWVDHIRYTIHKNDWQKMNVAPT
ncbi:GNAT family N-acetyltransferase [Gilvimarinus sp. 1_MG-2023]|uniref:GNAT family N-acetyltransferase n=1 Tax=Gilvimarinus sp. 1_MG-2023 TaxID=3062638 RepID=UPI0026E2FA27|nr:GNAT family protein [Gilvimarinus sp. 1_MG-2023]MDO6748192.1 GNAT family protein [Gilvimarinus sp. 1_MG-2023]